MRPLFRNAICWKRPRSVSKSKTVVSKISPFGQKVIVVPVSSLGPSRRSGAVGTPLSNSMENTEPFCRTSAISRVDSALTTDDPTPCRPPDTLYPPPPNLPPACSWVSTSSTALTPSLGWMSVGMPRPLSATRTPPSASSVTSIVSA